jgi:UDP-N-acetylmuramate-alanine ligase
LSRAAPAEQKPMFNLAESEIANLKQESKTYFSKGAINEADYYSPNFANLNNEQAIVTKIEYIHHLNTGSKYKANRGKLLTKLPGIAYRLVGEFLGEKLCMLLFTNRVSFKIAVVH